jgi:hypothetical protein
MDDGTCIEEGESCSARLAGTIKVVVLLLIVALLFSYLGAFALTNALVSVDLLDRWPANRDPRPAWMLKGFASLTAVFTILAVWLKWTTWRQLRRMDAMDKD